MIPPLLILLTRTTLDGSWDCLQDTPMRIVMNQSQFSLFPWNDMLRVDRRCVSQVMDTRGHKGFQPSQVPKAVILWASCRAHRLILILINPETPIVQRTYPVMWWMHDPCSHNPFILQNLPVRNISTDYLRTIDLTAPNEGYWTFHEGSAHGERLW
jgi:hypothetical protein